MCFVKRLVLLLPMTPLDFDKSFFASLILCFSIIFYLQARFVFENYAKK